MTFANKPDYKGLRGLFQESLDCDRKNGVLLDTGLRDAPDDVYKNTHGRIGATARCAGISPRTLFDMMKRLGLKKDYFRN